MNLREYAANHTQTVQEHTSNTSNAEIAQEQRDLRAAKDKALNVYKQYQANKIHSNQIVVEINKGLQRGEDLRVLFLKAMQVISLLTDNELTYRGAANRIKENYTTKE